MMIKITVNELRQCRWQCRQQLRQEHLEAECLAMALYILNQNFGTEWVRTNVFQGEQVAKKPGMPFIPSPVWFDENSKTWKNNPVHLHRVIMLGDMIFNLQEVSGVDVVLDKIRNDTIESYYAELTAGKILRLSNILFRYRPESNQRTNSYDADMFLRDGRMLPCEMKCKIQTTGFSEATVAGALKQARTQLPPDKPGVIFINIPQWWPGSFHDLPPEALQRYKVVQMWPAKKGETFHGIEVDGWQTTGDPIAPSINKLFRSSKRVAFVIVCSDYLYTEETHSRQRIASVVRSLGLPGETPTKTLYKINARIYKNPNAHSSEDLPDDLFSRVGDKSNWLKLIDI